jgi:hypothetical protein
MKFKPGDEMDTALCVALKHEFLRCDEAFNQFAAAATIKKGPVARNTNPGVSLRKRAAWPTVRSHS